MKRTTKLLSVLLVLSMLLTIISVSVSAQEVETVILYTNDVHCAIDDYPVLAAYRAELIAQGKNVVTVDAGDAIQGEVIGSMTKGEAVVDIMNAVGYDYAVPGNHEFDYGMEIFLDLAQNKADYDYISSNFYYLSDVSSVFAPYKIEDFGDYQVAFIGISTPETTTKASPEYFKDENGNFIYGFPVYPDAMTNEILYENVQASVDNAILDGADIVVAAGHTGILETTDGWKSTDIIANTSGIDYYIDAHSHETIESAVYKNENNEDVILTSTGTKFANFGVLTISGNGAEFELVNPDNINIGELSTDARFAYSSVKNKVDSYNEDIEHLYEEIGTSEAHLIAYDFDRTWAVRKRETNAGDFVADAYRSVTGADVAIANGGGIRAEIEAGNVTRKMLMDVNAFNNDMCVLEVTGQQLIDVLEHGARKCPESLGSFFQVSGVTFELHTYLETPVVTDQLDNFIEIDETKERRVQNVLIDGKTVDLDEKYTLAGSAYVLLQGGDGLTMLDSARVIQQEGLPCDSEMLIKYFTETLDGRITSEQYGNPDGEGRIKIVDSHNHSFSESDECSCGAKKADYSGYDESYERFQKIMDNDNLNDAAIEYAREKYTEMLNEHLDGMWLRNNYSEDEQYILDGLAEDFNEMCDELEEGIEDGTFIKPDYTEIEEKIAEFEKTHQGEEYAELIAEMKADLEEIKASNPESAAEIEDDIAEIEAKIDNAEENYDANQYFRLLEFVLKIISYIFNLFF
ncbi:MAG: 5'-nucleotidase C-terminal domain-containing protein [Clostridia bacterium]|nr:5'-nucleotidase C-terminal domain-containing protein [Clostridia bacterium]